MNLVLIPNLGAIGAAISSVTAEFFILFMMIRYIYKRTNIRFTRFSDIMKSFLGSIVFIPLFFVLNQIINGWLLIFTFTFIGILIYVALELLMKHSSSKLFLNYLLSIKLNKRE